MLNSNKFSQTINVAFSAKYTSPNKEFLNNATTISSNLLFVNFTILDFCLSTNEHLLYDLVYNPVETVFLKKGQEKGTQIKNGLEMLFLQAEKAWKIWNNEQD